MSHNKHLDIGHTYHLYFACITTLSIGSQQLESFQNVKVIFDTRLDIHLYTHESKLETWIHSVVVGLCAFCNCEIIYFQLGKKQVTFSLQQIPRRKKIEEESWVGGATLVKKMRALYRSNLVFAMNFFDQNVCQNSKKNVGCTFIVQTSLFELCS